MVRFSTKLICVKTELFLVDNQSVAIDQAFDGDTEEGVVVDVFAVFTAGRGAQGSASGERSENNCGGCEDKKFFHDTFPFLLFREHINIMCFTIKLTPFL